jgi:hypothetical protein
MARRVKLQFVDETTTSNPHFQTTQNCSVMEGNVQNDRDLHVERARMIARLNEGARSGVIKPNYYGGRNEVEDNGNLDSHDLNMYADHMSAVGVNHEDLAADAETANDYDCEDPNDPTQSDVRSKNQTTGCKERVRDSNDLFIDFTKDPGEMAEDEGVGVNESNGGVSQYWGIPKKPRRCRNRPEIVDENDEGFVDAGYWTPPATSQKRVAKTSEYPPSHLKQKRTDLPLQRISSVKTLPEQMSVNHLQSSDESEVGVHSKQQVCNQMWENEAEADETSDTINQGDLVIPENQTDKYNLTDGTKCLLELSHLRFVKVAEWRGALFIHIRDFIAGNKLYASMTGITLSMQQYMELCNLKSFVNDCVTRAKSGEFQDQRVHLGGNKYISVTSQYKKVDLRAFWLPVSGNNLKATRRGISLNFSEWGKLADIYFECVNQYIAKEIAEFRPCYIQADHTPENGGSLKCKECNPCFYKQFLNSSSPNPTTAGKMVTRGRSVFPVSDLAMQWEKLPLQKLTATQIQAMQGMLAEQLKLDENITPEQQVKREKLTQCLEKELEEKSCKNAITEQQVIEVVNNSRE